MSKRSEIRTKAIRKLREAGVRVSRCPGTIGLGGKCADVLGLARPHTKAQARRITAQYIGLTVANTKRPEASDAFLGTFEWRKVRMQALKKYGARCQCCGATPADGMRMNVDHIKPRKTHPELALSVDNLQVLCEVCNHGKGNWDSTDWRPKLTLVAS